jgi:hypothetical protein
MGNTAWRRAALGFRDEFQSTLVLVATVFAYANHMGMLLIWTVLVLLGGKPGEWFLAGYLGLLAGMLTALVLSAILLPVIHLTGRGHPRLSLALLILAMGIGTVVQVVCWGWIGLLWDPWTL